MEAAAELILSDILSMDYNKDEYPTAEEVSKIEFHQAFIPDSLLILFKRIIRLKKPELRIVSICQAIIQAASPRRILAPLQIGLGLLMHHLTRSKFIVKTLYLLGLSCSYDEVQRYELCAAAAGEDDSIPNEHLRTR